MKPTVKIGSLLLAVVMALSAAFATGCSMSKEWSYKTSDKELAIGVYIYCLDLAYQQAQTKAKELDDYDGTNDKWLDLEITDDDGNTARRRQHRSCPPVDQGRRTEEVPQLPRGREGHEG